jgi:hypothetical protein
MIYQELERSRAALADFERYLQLSPVATTATRAVAASSNCSDNRRDCLRMTGPANLVVSRSCAWRSSVRLRAVTRHGNSQAPSTAFHSPSALVPGPDFHNNNASPIETLRWLASPHLLLTFASLLWAGNWVVGAMRRHPPVAWASALVFCVADPSAVCSPGTQAQARRARQLVQPRAAGQF